LLENVAFLALRRKTKEIYYYTSPGGYEFDFYLPESSQLIQVAQNLDNPVTREREIRALADAMRALKISRAMILSEVNSPAVEGNGFTIVIRSMVEWLLEG
jgi:predicted AAA+ superfamily ATPase